LIHANKNQNPGDIKLSWVSVKKSSANPKQNNEGVDLVRESIKMICESNNLNKVIKNKVAGPGILRK
jgi:hypothetical protein